MESVRPKLKIASAIFGSLSKVGGYQVFTLNLLAGLSNRGHDVTLFVPGEDKSMNKKFYDNLPFKVKGFPRPTGKLAKYIPFVLKIYVRFQNLINRFQVWQIIGSFPAAYIVSTLAGTVPLVLRAHGDDIQKHEGLRYGLRLDRRKELLITEAVNKMDKVIALNATISDAYIELEVQESRIAEVPNGVDIKRFSNSYATSNTRHEWNIPQEKFFLLTVGRFHEKKGYRLIPQIAKILKSRGANVHWLIVGANTHLIDGIIRQEEVSDIVETSPAIGFNDELNGNVVFEVPDEKLVRLYQCADMFVFPTLLEGFPRVLIEAMAARLPVVTTDAPGCREIMIDRQNGMVSAAGDVELMASNILALLKDQNLREHIVENGHSLAEGYDWEVILDKYEIVYKSLIDDIL